jgi:pimeloyl-ACP methyl ester carboxylesterase
VPAAIVCFEFDALFPPVEAARVAGHLGEAHVEVVPGTGHAGLFTQPSATVAAVLRALAG